MPISAPPPSWASIKNKPSTVSGFGITDIGSQSVNYANSAGSAGAVAWGNVSGKPTTVAGLGLSDFNASAIAAQAGASAGSVGTYGLFYNSGQYNFTLGAGSTTAGSNLRYAPTHGSGAGVGATPSGTWRLMGYQVDQNATANGASVTSVWLRIS